MTQATSIKNDITSGTLLQARALSLPARQDMLARLPSVEKFWNDNEDVLESAWREWEHLEQPVAPNEDVIDKSLRGAVEAAWQNPTTEQSVTELWQEASPGVYKAQFFDLEQLASLRSYLDQAAHAGIPTRPPYGLVLNRYGAMLDERSQGYLAASQFQTFYRVLFDKYIRPIARLLFPEIVGYDTQTFGFSIKWQAGMDTSLRMHTDASAVTININMNLPHETFSGSEVDFYDPLTGGMKRLSFEPGTAMIHRGHVAHASQPITQGERSNMVLWLYGDQMQVPQPSQQNTNLSAEQRWTVPAAPRDNSAPF